MNASNQVPASIADDEVMLRFILEALQCIQEREYSVVIEQRLLALMPKHAQQQYQADTDETVPLTLAHTN